MRILTLSTAVAVLAACGHQDRPKKHAAQSPHMTIVDDQPQEAQEQPLPPEDRSSDVRTAETALEGEKLSFESKSDSTTLKLPAYLFELQSDIPSEKTEALAQWAANLSLYAHTADSFLKEEPATSQEAIEVTRKRDAAQKAVDFLEARIAVEELKKQKKELADLGLQFHVIFYPGKDKNTRNEEIISETPSNLGPAALATLQDKFNAYVKDAETLAQVPVLNDKQFFTEETMAELLRKESAVAQKMVLKLTDEQNFANLGIRLFEQDDKTRLFNFEVDSSVLTFITKDDASIEQLTKGNAVVHQLESYATTLAQLAAHAPKDQATATQTKAKAAAQVAVMLKYRLLVFSFGQTYNKLIQNVSFDTSKSIEANWVQVPSDLSAKKEELKAAREAYRGITKLADEPTLKEIMQIYASNSMNTTNPRRTDILQNKIGLSHNETWLKGYEPALSAIEALMADKALTL